MTFASLAARNILRNKLRTFLTVMGVGIAVMTFLLLRTVISAWTAAADFAAKDRVVTRHKVTFVMQLPKRYIDKIRQMPDIKSATWANWFGAKDPKNDREFFATFAIDPSSYFEVYDEIDIPADQLAAFKADKSGVIVGDVLAKKMGWQVGQDLTLESGIYPAPDGTEWKFTIQGIYTTSARSVDRSTLFLQWDYMNDSLPEVRRDQIGWVVSRVGDASKTADRGLAIDKVFDDEDTQTLSQDERTFNTSFLAGFSSVLNAIDLVSVVILVIMTLVMGNTIAMGVRERTSEYGTMRAIGFMPKHIVFFVLGESIVLGALGGAVGVLLGYPFIERGLGRWIEENLGGFFPYFRVPPGWAVVAFFLAMLLGLLAALLPARQAAKIKVTDALRRVV
ncbi:MAG: FtsX-like permease family protein [Polyangiaceae bacterium]|nr:FtsX-like permease family protein [Polyangiaceae bacterium]MBK8937333.1 FtsX-like permease family protein [Polyangiaceae bacterium]